MEHVTLRLKALRESVRPKFSSRAMADALGMAHSTYAAYESPKKFKKPVLPFDLAKRIANVLAEKGADYDEVMVLAGLELKSRGSAPESDAEVLWVRGQVEAGAWRNHPDWPPEKHYPIEVGPTPVRGGERFALKMEGYSMDKVVPPDSDLECLRVSYGFIEPLPGDLVIAERHEHDRVEMTCKRLDRDGDEWVLRYESTKEEYQDEVIRLGKPDADLYIDNEVRIVGIVLKAHQSHWRRR